MNEEMKAKLTEEIREAMGTECEVIFHEVEKNNGLLLSALTIREPGRKVSPTIYLDCLLDGIDAGEFDLQDIVQEIVAAQRETARRELEGAIERLSKEEILQRVIYQVVNREKNEKRLQNMPHREFLDLAAIYQVGFGKEGSPAPLLTVNNDFCKAFGISAEELDAAAKRNTEQRGFDTKPLMAVLAASMGASEDMPQDDGRMWVLTTPSRINGAAVMLYGNYFDSLAGRLGSDLYVLPSSIHEVIVVPDRDVEPDTLRRIVSEVNNTEVKEEEVLGNNVYRYSRETKELMVA